MDQGLSGGGGRKKPVTKAQVKKQRANYKRADRIRVQREIHHLKEERQADQIVDEELGKI